MALSEYDYLGRVTESFTYASDDATLDESELRAESLRSYDDLGRVCESTVVEVDPATGDEGHSLVTRYWYDPAGNLVKTAAANGLFQKSSYDGLGRLTDSYTCFDTEETGYADALTVADDTVVEQSRTFYDAAGQAVASILFQRLPGDAETEGPLTAADAYATAAASWYDGVGRAVAQVNYGHENTSDQNHYFFDEESDLIDDDTDGIPDVAQNTPPAPDSSDDYLVSQTVYYAPTAAGRILDTLDNAGRRDRAVSDPAGRTVRTIRNYVDGTVGETDTAADITTEYEFDSAGRLVTLVARNAKGSGKGVEDQRTKYLYTSPISGSLQTAAVYPDSTDALSQNTTTKVWTITTDNGDHTSATYDRLGRLLTSTDQRGVEHTFRYDSAGRQDLDAVTSLGPSGLVDDAILAVGTTYDDLGRVETVTTFADAEGISPASQVKYVYNGWGQVIREAQEHDGPVNANSPSVQYLYEDGAVGNAARYVRLASVVYPNGRQVNYDYAAGVDAIMSRLSSISTEGESTPHAVYAYLGAGRIVTEDFQEPDVMLDATDGAGNITGLDRFGRAADHVWKDYGASPATAIDEYRYGYDRAGNRLWKENVVSKGLQTPVYLDELYTYDAVDQLTGANRGQLVDGQNGKEIQNGNFSQDWTLDALGNWSQFDDDGSLQTREANAANEITSIDQNASAVQYDAAGNTIRSPLPLGEGQGEGVGHYIFDAWNRMTAVHADDEGEPGGLIAEYRYDGVGRRIEKAVTALGGGPSQVDYYLNTGNQVVEERIEGFSQDGWAAAGFVVTSTAVQADGRIVAAGAVNSVNGTDFALARYNPDGTLDTAFGDEGYVDTGFSGGLGWIWSVGVQTDGRIVAAGMATVNSQYVFALARYLEDGSLDSNFGTGGQVTMDFGASFAIAHGVAVQADGRIVAAGSATLNGDADFALARFDSDGELDTNFGSGGLVHTDFGGMETGNALALQADGKLVLGGGSGGNFALARYNADGSLDTYFGNAGKVTTDFGGGADFATSLAIQADGRIVLGGSNGDHFALARYNADGSLDSGFGTSGLATMEFTAGYAYVLSVALQADGRVVAAGSANNDFALARFNADGTPDAAFGYGGRVEQYSSLFGEARCVAVLADQRIFVGGTLEDGSGSVAVFQPDGQLSVAATTQYVWSPRYIDAPVLRDTFDAEGQLQAEDRLYYLGDANYNVTALVDPSGQVVERYVYSPYGMVTVCDADFAPVVGNQSAVGNTVLFAGRAFDPESGLDYYRARYYDAMMGRFVNRDPKEVDPNLYRYCWNNPVLYVDPTGLQAPALIGDMYHNHPDPMETPNGSWSPNTFFAMPAPAFGTTKLLEQTKWGCGGLAAWRAGTTLQGGQYNPFDIFKLPGAKAYGKWEKAKEALSALGDDGGLLIAVQQNDPFLDKTTRKPLDTVQINGVPVTQIIPPGLGSGNLASLLGTASQPFWEYATTGWSNEEDRSKEKIKHRRQLPGGYAHELFIVVSCACARYRSPNTSDEYFPHD